MSGYDKYIGQTFNEWTILEYIGKRKNNPYVKCKCSCGTIKEVALYSITNNKSKSCGCKAKELFIKNNPKPLINEIGNKYGKLTVIARAENKDTRAYWKCKCDCGKIVIVSGKQLRSGKTKSCGCLRREVSRDKRLEKYGIKPNQQYGKLTTLQTIGKDKNNNYLWKCKCECGNIIVTTTVNLKSGNTTSCGCIISKGEAKITKILEENNIPFKKQFTFDDLYINDGKAKFDFAIFNKDKSIKCLIEYQGVQHSDKNHIWYRPESDLKKKVYCKEKGIKLVEIEYYDYNKIDINFLKEKCNL